MGSQIDCEYVAAETGDVWLEDLALKLGGLPAHTFAFATPTTVTITRRSTPWWAIVIAVFFFPLGLIALIAKTDKTATIVVRSVDDGTIRVHVVGAASRALRERLYAVMPVAALAPSRNPQPVRVALMVRVAVLVGVGILVLVVVAATLK